MKGLLVCLEGIEGAGKGTQSELLMQKLKEAKVKFSYYKYPNTASKYGHIIMEHLEEKITLSVMEFCLLFVADMAKDAASISKKILKGEIVIADRYFLSTIAYQSAGGIAYGKMKELEDAVGLPSPNLIVYLDLDPESSLKRKMKQKGSLDRHEKDLQYMHKIRMIFEQLYSERYTGAKWLKIDANLGKEEISKEILKEIELLR